MCAVHYIFLLPKWMDVANERRLWVLIVEFHFVKLNLKLQVLLNRREWERNMQDAHKTRQRDGNWAALHLCVFIWVLYLMPISDGLIAPDKRTNREIKKKHKHLHTHSLTVTATTIHQTKALKSYLQTEQITTKNKV